MEQGITANQSVRPADAERVLNDALDALEDAEADGEGTAAERTRLTTRVLLALAASEFEQHGLEAALGPLERAVQMARTVEDRELQALGHSQTAVLLGRSGQVRAALDQLDLAAALLSELAPRDQCVVLLNRGMARSELRDLEGARTDFESARLVALENGLPSQQFRAVHNLGYAAFLAGDLPRALEQMASSEGLGSDVSLAPARLDRGRVLLEAGLVSEAHEVLTEAAALCSDEHQQVHGEVELELSRALAQMGDLDAAGTKAGSARERFEARGTPLWADRAQLEQLQIQLAIGRETDEVEAEAVDMAARAHGAGDPILTAHASLLAAEAAWANGDLEAAVSRSETAAALRETGTLTTRLRLDLVRARAAEAGGDDQRARGILRSAARDLHLAQGGSASLDLRTARGIHGVALADLDIALSVDHGAMAVLASSERWRNASGGLPVITPPDDAELARMLTELRAVRNRLRDQALRAQDASALREEHGLLQRRIRLRDWAIRGSVEGPSQPGSSPTGTRSLRAALAERDTDLVSFLAHDGELLSVGVVRDRATLRRHGPLGPVMEVVARLHADLQALATHGRGPMGPVLETSLQVQLERVEELLLHGLPRGRRLLVVPTLALATVPWGMLPSRVGVPTSTAASAHAWARRPRTVSGEIAVGVVAGPGLSQAEGEAADVAGLWGATPVPAAESHANDLRDLLRDNEIVHVAAHGRHDRENPLFSSVNLGDGPVFAHELANTGVNAGHVVLSACEVGLSTVRPGDEPLGLAAALLHLGASAVVAPVCRVPDDIAAETMVDYHRHLRAGVDAAEALATASAGGSHLARAFLIAGSPFRVTA